MCFAATNITNLILGCMDPAKVCKYRIATNPTSEPPRSDSAPGWLTGRSWLLGAAAEDELAIVPLGVVDLPAPLEGSEGDDNVVSDVVDETLEH